MADLDETQQSEVVRITNSDETDILELENGQLKVEITGNTDGTKIGNENNRLLVDSEESENSNINTIQMLCLLKELVYEMRRLNRHMEQVTDLEGLEPDPEEG